MSEMKISDPSRLHLRRKELSQIRKAARVLRDPGTTSSWKSPLSSTRSVAAAIVASSKRFDIDNAPIQPNGSLGGAKDKRVFLYNWKSQRSSSSQKRQDAADDDGDYESCSVQESVDDSLSDARVHLDGDSMVRVTAASKRRGSREISNAHLDVLSRYQQKELNLRRLLKGSMELLSDDTEEYSNSEDLRKNPVPSPFFSKPKHKNWSQQSPSRLWRGSRKEEDSSYSYNTPALSTSSYNRYYNRHPSTVESWDATTTSMNDGDDGVDDHLDLPGRQGCGIPCYWSKRTPRHRGGACGSCCSPSLSDTLRRKGSSMLCGSQSGYRGRQRSSSIPNKRKIASRSARGVLPLLRDSAGGGVGSSIGTGRSDDELSTNFGELDLEALSRLDGRRWSNCKSQDGLEIVALNRDREEEGTPETIRSLSHKYKPIFFAEVIGQNIVVQSLINSISRGRIAPVYLFQGPRGTGKTTTARIFACALNCMSTDEIKPCGYCRECTAFVSGNSRDLWEVDGTNKKSIDKMKYLLEKMAQSPPLPPSRYKVFLIDECHLLPSKMWLAFLKFLEEPPQQVVFMLITTDSDNVPQTVQSRCQKYLFNKVKDGDIVTRLRKISDRENLDVELDALDLIALNADGSLRDAETMLDQLGLLGKRITASLVNELVGVVSDDKLWELFEIAMSSDTAETVKRARDLMNSGVDPMVLMSQLASLIMDIIAGTCSVSGTKYSDAIISDNCLTEAELGRLKNALKLLSEAEKQLRVSSDRSTWFTATLLQLGSVSSPNFTQSSRQSSRTNEEDRSSVSREATVYKQKIDGQYFLRRSSSPASINEEAMNGKSIHQGGVGFSSKSPDGRFMDALAASASQDDQLVEHMLFRYRNSDKLDAIWKKCIGRCHSKTLRQLLHVHGKLLSISEVDGVLAVYIAFDDEVIKARAERFLSSITNSIEMVLRRNVEVRIINLSGADCSADGSNQVELQGQQHTDVSMAIEQEKKANSSNVLDVSSQQECTRFSKGSYSHFEGKLKGGAGDCSKSTLPASPFRSAASSTGLQTEANEPDAKDKMGKIPVQRIESIIRDQRLETAWLQAAEKGTPGSLSRLKPEKNQILPHEDIRNSHPIEPSSSIGVQSPHWENELNHELKDLTIKDESMLHKEEISKRVDQLPASPSLMHDRGFVGTSYKESLGYESGSASRGCGALFCWNKNASRSVKAKRTSLRSQRRKGRRFSLFCHRSKQKKN